MGEALFAVFGVYVAAVVHAVGADVGGFVPTESGFYLLEGEAYVVFVAVVGFE